MYSAFRNVRRALVPSKRRKADTHDHLAASRTATKLQATEQEQSASFTPIHQSAPSTSIQQWAFSTPLDERRETEISSCTYVSTNHVPTHICGNCGEDFCDEIEWKEHNIRCVDTKQNAGRFSCLQKGCSFLCSNEDDLKAHTHRAHDETKQHVATESDTNDPELESSLNAVQNHTLPFHCKMKAEGNTISVSENLPTDAKLGEADTPNYSITPGNNAKCGSEPNNIEHLKRPTPQLPNTEAIYSPQHAILQQAKLGRNEDHSELPHSSLEHHPMHNELIEPTVTKFLAEMLDQAMSSFDISSYRTFETCAKDESDSDSDEFDDYDSDTERFPANGTRNICSFLNTDGSSIQSTSSNTSSGFSTRPSAPESGSSSQTTSSGGKSKGKGRSGVSPEDRNKWRKRISPSKGRNGQDDGRGSDDENEHVEQGKPSELCTDGKNLACPFYQRRPQLYPKSTACFHPGFKTIARLKEHLYRQHYRISCPRCGQNFEEEGELKIHLRAKVACESTEEEVSEEYMTTQQRDQLRSKKRKAGQDTLEKKWESIYQLLFPDDMPPLPSPYCEPTVPRPTSSSSSHMADFQGFCFQQLRYLLMEKFKSDLRTLEPGIQARLKDSMDEILREAPTQIYRQWEEQHHTLASPSSQGSNQAGPNASKSASIGQKEIDATITQAQLTEPGQIEQPVVSAQTAEDGTQGSISISDLNEDFNGIAGDWDKSPDAEDLNNLLMHHATTAAVSTNLDSEQQGQVMPQIYEDPFDPSLITDWNDSFFGPLDCGTDTAGMGIFASELPGRRCDSPVGFLLNQEPDEGGYLQNSSHLNFEGPGTMRNREIDALDSELWGRGSSTAHRGSPRSWLHFLRRSRRSRDKDNDGNVE